VIAVTIEEVMNYVAWAASIAIFAWLVVDALRVEVTYDRDLLVSSVEGEIEKEILAHDEEAMLRRHAGDWAAEAAEVKREAQAHDQAPPGGGS
jgi:hypothetical protein